MKVYPSRDIRPFVMYCVNGKPRSSLLIESTDSMILTYRVYRLYDIKTEKTFKNEQRSKDAAAKKRPNTSGVGKINNYYEDIYIPPYNNTEWSREN